MMTSHGNCICMRQVTWWIYLVSENHGCWAKMCGIMLLWWEKMPYNTPQSPYSMFIRARYWDSFVVRIYKFALFLSDRDSQMMESQRDYLLGKGILNLGGWFTVKKRILEWQIDRITSALYALSTSNKTMNLVLSLVSKWRRYLFIQITIGLNCTLYLGLWIYLV